MDENLLSRRTIRSFVRRAGRLTPAQNKAMTFLLPKYGLDYRKIPADLNAVFGRRAPHIMEIGFGNGELLTEMADARPEVDFIGIEVHEPGIGRCLIELERRKLSNVRIICHDAVEVLQNNFPDESLDGVNLFFPDPWPKKRHHKRRIVQADFISLLARKIAPGGFFRAATDWADYAERIETAVAGNDLFEAAEIALEDRRQTKFEQRGKRLGHAIWERAYRRV
jgi:tRNA (guanine-N7-)-methyltransferase